MDDLDEARERVLSRVREAVDEAWSLKATVSREENLMTFDVDDWRKIVHVCWLGGHYAIGFIDLADSEELDETR